MNDAWQLSCVCLDRALPTLAPIFCAWRAAVGKHRRPRVEDFVDLDKIVLDIPLLSPTSDAT